MGHDGEVEIEPNRYYASFLLYCNSMPALLISRQLNQIIHCQIGTLPLNDFQDPAKFLFRHLPEVACLHYFASVVDYLPDHLTGPKSSETNSCFIFHNC